MEQAFRTIDEFGYDVLVAVIGGRSYTSLGTACEKIK
jgi:hypothetical protein